MLISGKQFTCPFDFISLAYVPDIIARRFKSMHASIEGPLEKLIGRSDLCCEPVFAVTTMRFTSMPRSIHGRINSTQET